MVPNPRPRSLLHPKYQRYVGHLASRRRPPSWYRGTISGPSRSLPDKWWALPPLLTTKASSPERRVRCITQTRYLCVCLAATCRYALPRAAAARSAEKDPPRSPQVHTRVGISKPVAASLHRPLTKCGTLPRGGLYFHGYVTFVLHHYVLRSARTLGHGDRAWFGPPRPGYPGCRIRPSGKQKNAKFTDQTRGL